MRRPSRAGLSWLFVLCANIPLTAQNLEHIGREKAISLSGGVSFNQVFYTARGLASRRNPYNIFASGNLNVTVYGWSIPLTFSASNHSTSFTQPFNQYSVHPAWKWITVHAGYTSMSFSPYSVNGHIFRGAGVELSPDGKWKFNALYGRFLKAVRPDTTANIKKEPSYQRMGYAIKTGYGDSRNFVDIVLFHAKDDSTSIPGLPDSLRITPQENLVLSIAGGKSILRHIAVKGEFAATAITKDTRSETTRNKNLLAWSDLLFQPRLSTSYYKAIRTSLDYQYEGWRIGCGYEYIDPGYRTFGAYYFNNDLENITMNGSATLLKDKLSLAITAGVQRDNLGNTKISTMRRIVSSVNMNYAVLQKLNVSASWSSFQTYTNIRPPLETLNQLTPYDNLDTLNFTQISRSATATGMYTLSGNGQDRQHINVNLTWQQATGGQGEEDARTAVQFYNMSAGYSVAVPSRYTNASLTFNATIHKGSFMNTGTLGPSASVSRAYFRRKVKLTLSSSWNRIHSNGAHINSQFNARASCGATVWNNHNLMVSCMFVNRKVENGSVAATELTGNIAYNYSFGGQRPKPKIRK